MFEPYALHTLVDDAEYRSVLQEFRDGEQQMLLIHMDVFKFAPSVMKRMVRDFNALRQCTDTSIFAIEPTPDNGMWHRYVSHMGFEFSSYVDCTDGESRRCYVSNKKKKNNGRPNDQFTDAEHQPEYAAVVSAAALPSAGVRASTD